MSEDSPKPKKHTAYRQEKRLRLLNAATNLALMEARDHIKIVEAPKLDTSESIEKENDPKTGTMDDSKAA